MHVFQREEIKNAGGKDVGDHVRNVLRGLMTKEVAVLYSWSGQKRAGVAPKKKFKDLAISNLIASTYR